MAPAPKHSHADQQSMILTAAANCIEQTSLLDFTMAAISKEAGLSMGSIYKHIQSKEDVLVALATQSYQHLVAVFKRVMALPLPYVHRLLGIQLLGNDVISLYSFGSHLEMLVSSAAVRQRASHHWLEQVTRADIACEEQCTSNILKAVSAGELDVSDEQRQSMIEEIKLGSWSLHVGFVQVARQRAVRQLGIEVAQAPNCLMPTDPIVQAQKRLLNSYPWHHPITDTDIESICQVMADAGLR